MANIRGTEIKENNPERKKDKGKAKSSDQGMWEKIKGMIKSQSPRTEERKDKYKAKFIK